MSVEYVDSILTDLNNVVNDFNNFKIMFFELKKEVSLIKSEIIEINKFIHRNTDSKSKDDLALLKPKIFDPFLLKEIKNLKNDIFSINKIVKDKEFINYMSSYRKANFNLRKGFIFPFNTILSHT